MKAMEELQKEINGKQVRYIADGLNINALFIWPPGGKQVSVKPFGYEPQEILNFLKAAGFGGYDIEDVSKPEFCLASHAITGDVGQEEVLRAISNIVDGGDYNYDMVCANAITDQISPPSCPYS